MINNYVSNPSIENSDVIRYIDKNIVVTKQTLMLDGGFSSEIECVGKLENAIHIKSNIFKCFTTIFAIT